MFVTDDIHKYVWVDLVGQMQNVVHRDQFRLEKIHRLPQMYLSQKTYINKDVDTLLYVKIVAWTTH